MSFTAAKIFGLTGSSLIILGVIISSLVYRGKNGERYSLFNHFISELGEVGVSRAAWAFNGALILGGLLLVPFNIALGVRLGSILGWLGAAVGCVAVLGVTAVGLFPMNNLKPHTTAAFTYFRGGLLMTLFYGLAVLFQPAGAPKIPYAVMILTFLALAAYAAFLAAIRPKGKPQGEPDNSLDPLQGPVRPRFWLLPTLEWAILFTTMLWLFATAAVI